MIEKKIHKAGFVNIIGKPNAGKSTLMNRLVGEKLSIITSKAQTTRHRVTGILSGDDFQIVYSDTPGIMKPSYELHKRMMNFVNLSIEDADIIIVVTDIYEEYDEQDVINKLYRTDVPVFLLVNKVDLADEAKVNAKIAEWKERIKPTEILAVSALHGQNTEGLFDLILKYLPEHPAYYPKDELTDRPEKFFAAEIVREKIFLFCKKEVPYSTEVAVETFTEEDDIVRIGVLIMVERKSQKGILIGKDGTMLKKIGTAAREDLETFFGKKVFLEQFVKIDPDWRHKNNRLNSLGYN